MSRIVKFLIVLPSLSLLIFMAVTYTTSTKAMVVTIIGGIILIAVIAAWMDVTNILKRERDRPY